MKKNNLLIFVFCFSFFVLNFLVFNYAFAALQCPADNKGDWNVGCYCDKTDLPYGGCDDKWGSRDIFCDTSQEPAVCQTQKKEEDPCNTDANCIPNEETNGLKCVEKHCKIGEEKVNKDGIPFGGACLKDEECKTLGGMLTYCNLLKKQNEKGTCDTQGGTELGEPCNGPKACSKNLDCIDGKCAAVKDGSGTGVEGDDCKQDIDCTPGNYCDKKKEECASAKADETFCSKDAECIGGTCKIEKDAEGNDKYIFTEQGKVLKGSCTQGKKEGSTCDENNKCAYGYVCESNICKKEILIGDRQREEIAASQLSSEITPQLNRYCSATTKKGLFTEGVSDDCWNCGNCGASDIMKVIANVINGMLQTVGLFAVFSSIVSGFMYIISRGNEEKTTKAKGALTASIIGLIIIFTGWILINTIMTVLGYNCGSWYAPTFNC